MRRKRSFHEVEANANAYANAYQAVDEVEENAEENAEVEENAEEENAGGGECRSCSGQPEEETEDAEDADLAQGNGEDADLAQGNAEETQKEEELAAVDDGVKVEEQFGEVQQEQEGFAPPVGLAAVEEQEQVRCVRCEILWRQLWRSW